MNGFFITGTDTGVGKTFIACALIRALTARGFRVAPMKPVAAGTIVTNGMAINDDVEKLIAVSGRHFPRHLVNPYCFRDAIAPHIAAKREGILVDLSVIQSTYRELSRDADIVIVEGAGGFLVPLTDDLSMALIPAALQLPVILVVGMRLGCINHALLTVEALHTRGLTLSGWVANTAAETMNAYDENLSTLKAAIAAPLIGEVARLSAADSDEALIFAASRMRTEVFA